MGIKRRWEKLEGKPRLRKFVCNLLQLLEHSPLKMKPTANIASEPSPSLLGGVSARIIERDADGKVSRLPGFQGLTVSKARGSHDSKLG